MLVSFRLLASLSCPFSLSLSLSLFLFSAHFTHSFFLVLALRSFVRSFCRKDIYRNISRVVEPRSYARNQKKKPIVYLSFSSFDCLLSVCVCVYTIPTSPSFTVDNKKNKQKKKITTTTTRRHCYPNSTGQRDSVVYI